LVEIFRSEKKEKKLGLIKKKEKKKKEKNYTTWKNLIYTSQQIHQVAVHLLLSLKPNHHHHASSHKL
jgi:hypothetical protein